MENPESIREVFSALPFVLIDGVQWAREFNQGKFDDLYPKVLVPEGMEADEDKLPRLVNMALVDDDVRDSWAETIINGTKTRVPTPFGAVLQIDRNKWSSEEIRAHLTQHLIQRDRHCNQKFLLRYFDPRVFAHLPRILQAPQMRLLFGPVQKWHYCHRNAWQTYSAPAVQSSTVMIIDESQWRQLHRIGEINRVVAALCDQSSQPFNALALAIDGLLMKALNLYKFGDGDDRVAFAMHGMTIHRHFDMHPLMRELLARLANEPESSYRAETQAIPEDKWQAIRCWNAGNQDSQRDLHHTN